MLNKVFLMGRLGKDVEMRATTGGTTVGNVSIACSEKYTDKEGVKQENTEWINLVFWGRTAEIADQYTKKGDLIHVEGRMKTRSWEDRDGQKKYTTEVHVNQLLLMPKQGAGGPPPPTDADHTGNPLPSSSPEPAREGDSLPPQEDDLPF